jgi:hypothetical protein
MTIDYCQKFYEKEKIFYRRVRREKQIKKEKHSIKEKAYQTSLFEFLEREKVFKAMNFN